MELVARVLYVQRMHLYVRENEINNYDVQIKCIACIKGDPSVVAKILSNRVENRIKYSIDNE